MATDQGLRPELSVLLPTARWCRCAYYPEITDTYGKLLVEAFPKVLREKFATHMQQHPLRSEIIATKLTNNMVNDMGLNFVFRMQEETGASVSEIADAYAIVHGIFNMKTLWERIEQLDNVIPAQLQLKMLDEARRIMRRASRWYIRHGNKTQSIEEAIASYRGTFDILSKNLQNYLVESETTQLENATHIDKGVPKILLTR